MANPELPTKLSMSMSSPSPMPNMQLSQQDAEQQRGPPSGHNVIWTPSGQTPSANGLHSQTQVDLALCAVMNDLETLRLAVNNNTLNAQSKIWFQELEIEQLKIFSRAPTPQIGSKLTGYGNGFRSHSYLVEDREDLEGLQRQVSELKAVVSEKDRSLSHGALQTAQLQRELEVARQEVAGLRKALEDGAQPDSQVLARDDATRQELEALRTKVSSLEKKEAQTKQSHDDALRQSEREIAVAQRNAEAAANNVSELKVTIERANTELKREVMASSDLQNRLTDVIREKARVQRQIDAMRRTKRAAEESKPTYAMPNKEVADARYPDLFDGEAHSVLQETTGSGPEILKKRKLQY